MMRIYFVLAFVATTMALPATFQIEEHVIEAIKIANAPMGAQNEATIDALVVDVLSQTKQNYAESADIIKVATLPEYTKRKAESVKLSALPEFTQTKSAADEAVKIVALPEKEPSSTVSETVKVAPLPHSNEAIRVVELPLIKENMKNTDTVKIAALPVQNINVVQTLPDPAASVVQVASKPIAQAVQVASLELAVNKPASEVVQTAFLPIGLIAPDSTDLSQNVVVQVGEPSPIAVVLDENENNHAPVEVVLAGPTPLIAENPFSGNIAEISLSPTLVQDLNMFSADIGGNHLLAQALLKSNSASIDINLNIKFDDLMRNEQKVRVAEM